MGNYEYYNYKDLSITSAKKPQNTHLFLELDNGYLLLVDSTSQTDLLISTDKGDNWDTFQTGDFTDGKITRTKNIISTYYDRTNSKVYVIDWTTGDDITVWYLDLSDYSINIVGADIGTADFVGLDIFIRDSNLEILVFDNDIIFQKQRVYRWTDPNWVVAANYDAAFIGVNTSFIVDVSNTIYFFSYSHATISMYSFDGTTMVALDTLALYEMSSNRSLHGIAYDGSNLLYMNLEKSADNKNYLVSYSISGDVLTALSEHSIALMLDRNTDSTADPPNNLEKAFHISADKVYQIPISYSGRLNLISKFNFTNNIIGITDSFVIDDGGKVYEYANLIDSIFNGIISHSRNDFPYLEMKYNSDDFTVSTQQFVQIIGPYTVDGSTTSNKVIFEGIAKKPTKGIIQYVLVENQASEIDQVQPAGIKSGRTDEIIIDINDDSAPNGPEYIRDGTLSNGGAMGTLVLGGAKDYREVLNDFAEHDAFLWSLRPQGTLDYNNGGIDSGGNIRLDGSTYTDPILQMKAWTIAKLNQIIVNGAMKTSSGELYSGQWDDEDDQQENGINSATIEDAQLNTDVLCQAKADTLGGNETERTRARFKFRKTSLGFVQPGQTITFKYDITNYITIAEAQYIVDKMILNIKSEMGYMEISSGL